MINKLVIQIIIVSILSLSAFYAFQKEGGNEIVIAKSSRNGIYLFSPSIVSVADATIISYEEFSRTPFETAFDFGNYHRVTKVVRLDEKNNQSTTGLFSFGQSTLFSTTDDSKLYILGISEKGLFISNSVNNGKTWSKEYFISDKYSFHSAPNSPIIDGDRLYFTIEANTGNNKNSSWPVNDLTTVIMEANINSDLTNKKNWILNIGNHEQKLGNNKIGLPLEPVNEKTIYPIGALEGNLIIINDDNHTLYKESSIISLSRVNTGGIPNIASIKRFTKHKGKLREEIIKPTEDNSLEFIHIPGGHLKFAIRQHPDSGQYILVSNISEIAGTKQDALPSYWVGDSSQQRNKIGIYSSKNLFNWQPIDTSTIAGKEYYEARSYPSFAFNGDKILIVCRSSSKNNKDPHNTDLITLHSIDLRKI